MQDLLRFSVKEPADWLQSISELERADLRGSAIDQVCAFLETWPPLKPSWRPKHHFHLNPR